VPGHKIYRKFWLLETVSVFHNSARAFENAIKFLIVKFTLTEHGIHARIAAYLYNNSFMRQLDSANTPKSEKESKTLHLGKSAMLAAIISAIGTITGCVRGNASSTSNISVQGDGTVHVDCQNSTSGNAHAESTVVVNGKVYQCPEK